MQTPSVSEAVGPAPSLSSSPLMSGKGALQVYSATERHEDGKDYFYYPHTGYVIYDTEGKKVRAVINHVGSTDQKPFVVSLPPGQYLVVALAEGYGRVRIPVVIRSRQLTVLRLERGWKPPEEAAPANLVRMPDGQPIGWRVKTEKQ